MNYKENYQQEQKDVESHKLIRQFNQISIDLVACNPERISYQFAYDVVYKLTKQNQQEAIIHIIKDKISELMKEIFQGIVSKERSIEQLNEIFKEIGEKNQKFLQICLYLDVNYFQKQKNSTLKSKLYEHTFSLVCQSSNILQFIADGLFESRQQVKPEFNELLKLIKQLDQTEQFFEKYLLKHYEEQIRGYYGREGEAKWKEYNHKQYLSWCKQQMQKEKVFIESLFVQKRKFLGLQTIISVIYECIVLNFKERIYQIEDTILFEELTISILELFSFSKNKEVQGHVQWFLKGIEKRLNNIPLKENTAFINSFCQLYKKINEHLKDNVGRFQITYRSVFTFEQWINNEKYSIPQRLSLFINEQLISKSEQPFEIFTANAALILKLLKEKTLFENMYRRSLLERLGQFYLTYNLEKERKLVETMEKQCGEDWTKKIISIFSMFQKNREKAVEIKQENKEKGCILPIIIQENDWPFEQKQSKISLHAQLKELIPQYENFYIQNNKNHKLIWSPKIGTVTMTIKFNKTKRDVLVSIEAANILLYLQKGPQNLVHYLCETGYKLDEVQRAVHILTTSKLVTSSPKGSDVVLQLANEFQEGGLLDLALVSTLNNVQVKAMEELKAQRKLMVQAIVVKIIKHEKKCKRTELVQKTAPMLTQRGFNFNADFVQKSIDRLLDKQFIRDIEDGFISYIA